MKKIMLLLAGWFTISPLFAQSPMEMLPLSPIGPDEFYSDHFRTREITARADQRMDSVWTNNQWGYLTTHQYKLLSNCLLATDTSLINGIPAYLTTYEYDASVYGAITQKLYLTWNGTLWDTTTLEKTSYYPDGYAQTYLKVKYQSGSWDTLSCKSWIRTFDGAGRPLTYTEEYYSFFDNGFVNDYQYIYQYYSDSTLMGRTFYNWEQNSFVPLGKTTGYTYNYYHSPYDYQMNHYYSQGWNGFWQTELRDTLTYDSYGSRFEFAEVTDGANWFPSAQFSFIRDEHGTLTETTNESWNGSQWIMEIHNKYVPVYDLDDNLVELIYQNGTGTTLGNVFKYVYSDFESCELPSAVEEVSNKSDIKIYPNPVTDHLVISAPGNIIAKVVVTDLFGKRTGVFYQDKISSIDVSSWIKGMYLIQLFDKQNLLLKSEKVIKM